MHKKHLMAYHEKTRGSNKRLNCNTETDLKETGQAMHV